MEGILMEVAKVLKDHDSRYESKFVSCHAEGKIGDAVTAQVTCHLMGHPSRYNDKACVELRAGGRNLAKIYTYDGYVLGSNRNGVIGVSDTTTIALVSPHWNKENGVVTKTQVTPEPGRSPAATQRLYVYHSYQETADWVIDQLCDVVQQSLSQNSDKKRKLVIDFQGGKERVLSNRYKLERVLLAVEKAMPKLDHDFAYSTFKGDLNNGVTFDGACHTDFCTNAYKDMSITLRNKKHALGTITADGGFTERLYGEVRGLRPSTNVAVVSPRWTETEGRITTSNTNVQNTDEKAIQQLTIYHAADESADTVVNEIYAAAFREKMTVSQKLHNLLHRKDDGRTL